MRGHPSIDPPVSGLHKAVLARYQWYQWYPAGTRGYNWDQWEFLASYQIPWPAGFAHYFNAGCCSLDAIELEYDFALFLEKHPLMQQHLQVQFMCVISGIDRRWSLPEAADGVHHPQPVEGSPKGPTDGLECGCPHAQDMEYLPIVHMAILIENMVRWDYRWPSIYSQMLCSTVFFTYDLKCISLTQTLRMIDNWLSLFVGNLYV